MRGLSAGGDVRSTRGVLEALGVSIVDRGAAIEIDGRGWAGLDRPPRSTPITLDCGNSGTSARLLLGLLAARRGRFRLIGDESLSRRPMRRVTAPLSQMGAEFNGGGTLPLEVQGTTLRAVSLATTVASAQVKSALILAALQAEGSSAIDEPIASRDHTERLLMSMGAPLHVDRDDSRRVLIDGGAARLAPLDLTIPGDPSSAAFALALAALLPGSEVTVTGISLNPRRLGFYRLLERMGAEIFTTLERGAPEPVGSITARHAELHGVDVTAEEVVDAIDELPLLAVVAAAAEGETVIRGAEELRHKESDRITSTATLLRAFGASVEELTDGLVIQGGTRWRVAHVDAQSDHRIAMAATVAAALAPGPSTLDGARWVAISYPRFFDDLDRLTSV